MTESLYDFQDTQDMLAQIPTVEQLRQHLRRSSIHGIVMSFSEKLPDSRDDVLSGVWDLQERPVEIDISEYAAQIHQEDLDWLVGQLCDKGYDVKVQKTEGEPADDGRLGDCKISLSIGMPK